MPITQPEQTKTDTFRITHNLTWAGVLPFFFGAIALWAKTPVWAPAALQAYGWLILSFMAGTLWGFAKDNPRIRVLSVTYPLLAWATLLAVHNTTAVLLIEASLIACLLLLDHELEKQGAIEPHYFQLRKRVTLTVVGCLVLAAIAAT